MLLVVGMNAQSFTVVIDPGHGGKDAGAVGRNLHLLEKNLNLEVSKRLAAKIKQAYPQVKVILTRETDVFIPLQGRANIVNQNNADLFICIHTNAADNRAACGAETFILGTDRMEDNLDVAMRENAVMKLEADYQTAYQGFDPNSVDSYIMFELMQNQYMDQSLAFASLVQTQFTQGIKRDDRGVRQAAFWVLLKSACPSVLVEMGFISNAEEEKYMGSEKGKEEITNAMFVAFSQYYNKLEGVGTVSTDSMANQLIASTKNEAEKPAVVQPTNEKKISKEEKQEYWGVQLFSAKREVPKGDATFKGLKNCTYVRSGAWYKYIYGKCKTREEAQKLRDKVKKDFPDCFVVKY